MKRILNISNFYIFLWCVYNLQGVVYPSGSAISQAILVIIMLLSLFYFAYLNIQRVQLPSVIRCLNLLIIFFSIYGITHMLFGEENVLHTSKFGYLKNIYMTLLPIYPFYSFAQSKILDEKALQKWIPVFFIVAIACFYSRALTLNEYTNSSYEYESDFTNNSGYLMLALLPATLLYREKPIIQYSLLIIALFFIILGLKRGAILIAGVCLLWIFYQSLNGGATIKEKSWTIFFCILIMMFVFYYLLYLIETNEYFLQRVEQTLDGSSSGRDVIFSTLRNHFINNTSAMTLFWGAGADATINIAGNYAHNDWLEIAINNGIIGIVIYTLYWIALFKTCRNAKSYPKYYLILTTFWIIAFMKTLFSMSYNSLPIHMTSVMAWALASFQTTQLRSKKDNKHTVFT